MLMVQKVVKFNLTMWPVLKLNLKAVPIHYCLQIQNNLRNNLDQALFEKTANCFPDQSIPALFQANRPITDSRFQNEDFEDR